MRTVRSSIRKAIACAGLVSAVFLAGCAGPVPVPYVNGAYPDKKDYGAPETHGLIYGYITRPGFLGIGTQSIDLVEFAQINPKHPAMLIAPGRDGKVFFIQPVPIGATVNLVKYQYAEGRVLYYGYPGVQKGFNICETVTKPGLHYAGSFILMSEDTSFRLTTPDDFGFHKKGTELERDALSSILPKFGGTPWDSIIRARIKELENAKK